METNFFSSIQKLDLQTDLKMNLSFGKEGRLTFSVLLAGEQCGDDARKIIPPMIFKGTPEELDEGFFNAFGHPAKETASLFANMEIFLKQKEEADKQSQMRKAQEAKEAKEKEERKKKFEEQIKKVDELESKKLYGQAIGQMPKAENFPEQEEDIIKRLTDLNNKHSQPSLF